MRYDITRGAALALTALLAASSCKGLLDVDNPNNVAESSLSDPQSAVQQANGVQASTVRMLSAIMTPYATATDELDWIGSREAWKDLERGAISNFLNEFTDQAFPFVGEARYLGDETIKRLEGFNAQGRLTNRSALARTYLYTAITYSSVADMFEDFALSNKQVPAKPLGRANMNKLYDTAIGYLVKAEAVPGNDDNLKYAIVATRARIKHGRAVWTKITPEGQRPADPLVNDAGANADAQAALVLLTAPDDRFRMKSNIEAQPGINVWNEVNSRKEMRVGTAFTTLKDPISGTADPVSARLIADFTKSPTEGFFTIASDRELRLILAEAALAAGDMTAFTTQINAVRALDNLPPYAGQVPARDILVFERQSNLFMQLRRLADLYRFGLTVAEWTTDPNYKSAVNTPGLLFPIPNIERLANPCIDNPNSC